MNRKFKFSRVLVLTMLVLVLSAIPVMPAFAETSQNVLVTSTPSYIAIANDPGTWTPNDLVGDGVTQKGTVGPDTIYWSNPLGDNLTPSNPVVDGECRFTLTNTSTVNIKLTVEFPDFASGDASTNSDDGSNGATTFGAYSYFSGDNYSTGKTVAKKAASAVAYDNLTSVTGSILWGLMYETQTTAWASPTAMTSTVTITAASA